MIYSVKTYDYPGPSVFGFETDAPRRVASISVHTSPLASLGSKDAGGMNVYVRELSCHTAALGIPVDIFTRRTDPHSPDTIELCPGVTVVNITAGPPEPLDKNALFDYLPEFAEGMVLHALRAGVRYDVVHAHYWLSGWVAHLLKRYWGSPFVLMFHTLAHMKNAVSRPSDRETALRMQVERRLMDLADSLIAANPAERADLIWRQHTPANKICTIPPGVDTARFTPQDREESRRLIGVSPAERVITFVGRVDPIKGIDTLLETAAVLDARSSDFTVLFIGGDLDGDGKPIGPLADVAAEAECLGVRDHFRFVGAQPQERLPLFYSAADVVVVPSRYESFGLVAVEAMACGVPVVASRVGGLIYTIEEGESGFLVPAGDAAAFADACERLLSDAALRERMGQRGHAIAQRFAWPVVAESVVHVYQRLASGSRSDLCCPEPIFA